MGGRWPRGDARADTRLLRPGCGRGGGPPFRRPRTLPCPGRLCHDFRLSHTSLPALTRSPRPVNTHESARVAPDHGLISDFCLRESEDTTLAQYSLEQRGVSNRRHSVLASDLAGVSVYWLSRRRNRRAERSAVLVLPCGLVGVSGFGLLGKGRLSVCVGGQLGIQTLF